MAILRALSGRVASLLGCRGLPHQKEMPIIRIPRQIPDLLESLRKHVKLLREFSARAFRDGDLDYLGEVAAKLRLLVYEHGRNKPLLLALMDEFGIDVPITLGGPPIQPLSGQPGPGDQVSLREFLELPACGVRVPSGGFVQLTKKEFIGVWAQQHGAAHEDWELNEELAVIRGSRIYIGGRRPEAEELRLTTKAVIYVADKFLSTLTPGLIELKTAERALKVDPNSIQAHHGRGVALAKLGRYDEALAEFKKVIKADPKYVKTYNNMGLTLHRMGRFPEAVEAYERAIALDNNYGDARYNLACAYCLQGNFDKCLEELERVKQLDGFVGKTDPISDPDLANIRSDSEYGPRFKAVVGRQVDSD